jgi:hypothetical protein
MRRRIFFALLGWAAAVAGSPLPTTEAALRASKPEVKREVVAVIEAQLEAFRRNDGPRAYGWAAAELRAQKPLPVFLAIVRGSYPEIWSSVRAEPGIVRDNGTRAAVTMRVFSAGGNAAYDYTLRREPAGWRILGVQRHEPAPNKKL